MENTFHLAMGKHILCSQAAKVDPFAEGVLPICIGKATRLIEYLDDDKALDKLIKDYGFVERLNNRHGLSYTPEETGV